MAELTDTRVAVYIDFDNIVISRFSQVNGRMHRNDKMKDLDPRDPETAVLLKNAEVDLGAVLDFASSFGTVAVSRAYADWSVPVNSEYSGQLIDRAVDLIQLFPATKAGKNGADIRLALDVADDLFRFPHLTHVVIVAGDSDYIALAQRCKQLGRYVIGIGVTGSISPAFALACNEFKDYDALPGVTTPPKNEIAPTTRAPRSSRPKAAANPSADLLLRAFALTQAKDDDEWLPIASIKNQMLRLDPTFQERALGFKSFTEFVQSLSSEVELDNGTTNRRMRLVTTADGAAPSAAGSTAPVATQPAASLSTAELVAQATSAQPVTTARAADAPPAARKTTRNSTRRAKSQTPTQAASTPAAAPLTTSATSPFSDAPPAPAALAEASPPVDPPVSAAPVAAVAEPPAAIAPVNADIEPGASDTTAPPRKRSRRASSPAGGASTLGA
jgi:hypothetical protein